MCQHRILIADDDREFVHVLAKRCESAAVQVMKAYDAVTTLTTVRNFPPDLVILDIEMPCGNGLSVCEMMASEPFWSKIPVIILTGRNDEETIRRCHELCAFYVPKGGEVWERVEPLLEELLVG